MTKIKYFSWVREQVGCDGEEIELPHDVDTGHALVAWLQSRYPHTDVFAEPSLKMALDRKIEALSCDVRCAEEIAFFPPMTGG